MSHWVYILYSKRIDKYYVGETENLSLRLQWHNSGKFEYSFTKITNDWKYFFYLECENRTTAKKIEQHIKRMKSRKYIKNLIIYREISNKLLKKYS